MIRINFRKNAQVKIVRHRQKISMTRGTWLLSAAVFFIVALFLFLMVRAFLGQNRQEEIGLGHHSGSFSYQATPQQAPATMPMN